MEVRVLNNISREDRARVVATAGSLSRFDGNVMIVVVIMRRMLN